MSPSLPSVLLLPLRLSPASPPPLNIRKIVGEGGGGLSQGAPSSSSSSTSSLRLPNKDTGEYGSIRAGLTTCSSGRREGGGKEEKRSAYPVLRSKNVSRGGKAGRDTRKQGKDKRHKQDFLIKMFLGRPTTLPLSLPLGGGGERGGAGNRKLFVMKDGLNSVVVRRLSKGMRED